MLTQPFLTELDSRAAVKGSVDPLGIQSIWVQLGRAVVGNLTTVSTSVRDFTILLAGYHLAQRAVESAGAKSEVEAFLKWEQLVSYVRARELKEGGFRGVTRVQKRLGEGDVVVLSAAAEDQTLANQRLYGIFGLYWDPIEWGPIEDTHRFGVRGAAKSAHVHAIDTLDKHVDEM